MRLENMEQEFPKMPEDMRAMVEREVEKQMKQTNIEETNRKRKNHWTTGRAAAVALVATMALGTTVFAGVKLFQMRGDTEGNYGLVTKIEQQGSTESGGLAEKERDILKVKLDIPNVKMEATYLPEGMKSVNEEGIYSYEGSEFQGGFSVFFFRMDMGDDAFEVLDKNVVSSEKISLNGHDGIYFEKQNYGHGMPKHIYLSYPEIHYVLDLYVGEDVSKEEALKFAEGIRLTPTDDEAEIAKVRVTDWSIYVECEKENAKLIEAEAEDVSVELWRSMAKEEFDRHTHKVGESFPYYEEGTSDLHSYPGAEAKVAKVEVLDNISSVTDADFQKEIKKYTAADGSFLPIDLNYVKFGDGIERLDEIVEKEEVTPKFVVVTTEYTNHGEAPLEEVMVNHTLMTLQENGENMEFYERRVEGKGTAWDECEDNPHLLGKESTCFKLNCDKKEKNYILDLQPGETAVIQAGFFVTEEELSHMYLNIDNYAIGSEFSDTGLAVGYIDIRQ